MTLDGKNRTTKSRQNQTARKKETYLGILEADTIKHAMKEKKNTSGERENYSKPNYIAEILNNRGFPLVRYSEPFLM